MIPIALPPLRERREDMPLLAEHFLRRFAEKNGKAVTRLHAARRSAALERYAWPGNVRELQERRRARGDPHAAARRWTRTISPRRSAPAAGPPQPAPGASAALTVPLGTPMEEVERLVIRETLGRRAATRASPRRSSGIAARTIYRKLDRDEEGRLLEPGAGGGGRRSADAANLAAAGAARRSRLPNWQRRAAAGSTGSSGAGIRPVTIGG